MQPFYLVVCTYLRLLVVDGISHFGAECALALLSLSATAPTSLLRLTIVDDMHIYNSYPISYPRMAEPKSQEGKYKGSEDFLGHVRVVDGRVLCRCCSSIFERQPGPIKECWRLRMKYEGPREYLGGPHHQSILEFHAAVKIGCWICKKLNTDRLDRSGLSSTQFSNVNLVPLIMFNIVSSG